MPVVEVHLIEGYAAEARQRLGRALTRAVRSVIPAAPEGITVMIHEMDAASYMRGGEAKTPAPPLPDPVGIVRGYLAAMEARDLDRAREALGPGFEMVFPGGVQMTTPEELLEWSRPRYREVRKSYDAWEAFPSEDGARAIVWCRGTLAGLWPDGTPFEGIRFVDRFEIEDGRIVRQDVWNDMGEARP